jgi:hypothetical protein
LRYALEAAGVEFIDENGGGAGVRLRKAQIAERRRPIGFLVPNESVKYQNEANFMDRSGARSNKPRIMEYFAEASETPAITPAGASAPQSLLS